MNDVVIQTDDVEPTSATSLLTQEPRWPIVYALFTCWVYPATTARRTAHVPLWQVWLFHFCSALLIFFTIMILIAFSEAGSFNFIHIVDRFIDRFSNIGNVFQHYPFEIIAAVLGIQLVFIIIPFFLMAWGAQDEPLKSSYRNALRQLWIRTAHISVGLITISIITVILGIAKENWRGLFYQKPWHVEHLGTIIVLSSIITALWILLALLRSMGATRKVPKIDRPPLCEACGYNLTSMPMDSRCPECGEYVIDSLGPEARTGTLWEKQYQTNKWQVWKESFLSPIRSSQPFGRQIQVTQSATAHRYYFAMHLPMIFFIGAISLFCSYINEVGIDDFMGEPAIVLLIMPIDGCACVIGTVIVTLFAGWLIGWAQSMRHKRNLMPASMQASCYLTGYLVLWAIFGALNAGFINLMQELRVIHEINYMTGMYRDTIAAFMFLIPNAICGVYYLLLVARVTSGAWYANR